MARGVDKESKGSFLFLTGKLVSRQISYAEYKQKFRNSKAANKLFASHRFVLLEEVERRLSDLCLSAEIATNIMKAARKSKREDDFNNMIKTLDILQRCHVVGEIANQFFKGGHFIANDDGALYGMLSDVYAEFATNRISSHFVGKIVKDEQGVERQKGIGLGNMLPALLFFETTDAEGHKRSHMQAESSPWRGARFIDPETIQHIVDAFIYFVCKLISTIMRTDVMNCGPNGWSPYACVNPIESGRDYAWKKPVTRAEQVALIQKNMNLPAAKLEDAVSLAPVKHSAVMGNKM